MPVAWIRSYCLPEGKRGRAFTTTMGSSTDLGSPGLRRLVINAVYWGLGMEAAIEAHTDVELVGDYEPTMYGFGEFQPGLKPSDHALD